MTVTPAAGAPMTVAVECSRLAHDVRGIGRYVRALLPRLVAQRAALQLVPFARREHDLGPLQEALAALGLPTDRAQVRRFADLRAGDPDLYWYPWNVARPLPRTGRVVTTIHDVAPLALPDPRRAKWWQNRRWRRLYAATAKRSDLIIADSQFTADELHRFLDVPYERVRVIHLAADDLPVPSPACDADALSRLGVRAPFVLAVSANDRRKNLALLDRAMPHVAELVPSARLVMVGPRRTGEANAEPAWRHSTGFVSEQDLASLYRSARAIVVPSLYEGFGLPVLEAMRLGTPVICTRLGSLPEVAGDAAHYVSPDDGGELALAIARLLADDTAYESMRRAGLAQAARFSWDLTAQLTLSAFDDALGR